MLLAFNRLRSTPSRQNREAARYWLPPGNGHGSGVEPDWFSDIPDWVDSCGIFVVAFRPAERLLVLVRLRLGGVPLRDARFDVADFFVDFLADFLRADALLDWDFLAGALKLFLL